MQDGSWVQLTAHLSHLWIPVEISNNQNIAFWNRKRSQELSQKNWTTHQDIIKTADISKWRL